MQIAIECSLIKRCVFIFSFVCTCSGSTDFIHTSNNCYLVPLLGEDSHFDYILLFNWVETTNQIQISFYHLSSRIHATHRSTVMWLHWFRLRGGQWLGPFFLWLGWVLVMSCDFKPFQWNPGWWNVCVTSNVHIIEMNISIFSTQIWRAFWKFLATKSKRSHLRYRGEQFLGSMPTLSKQWPLGLKIAIDSIVYSLCIED